MVPNFYRRNISGFFSLEDRHSSEQAGLGKREGKIFLRKRWKIGSYCNCQPNGLTCLGNLFLGKLTGSNGSIWWSAVQVCLWVITRGKKSSSTVSLCHFHFSLACCLCGAQFPHHGRQIGAWGNSYIRLVKISFIIKSVINRFRPGHRQEGPWRNIGWTGGNCQDREVPLIKAVRSRRYWWNNSV